MSDCPLAAFCSATCPGTAACPQSVRAAAAAAAAAHQAKISTGWKAWLWLAITLLLAAASAFLASGCAAAYSQSPGNITAAIRVLPLAPEEVK